MARSVVAYLTLLLGIPSIAACAAVWRESTFEDFKDGTFGDGGANTYVSRRGKIQTVNRWDVNGDGNIDILFANSHPLKEMLDMSIYWGNGRDFSIRNHTYVPAEGPRWATPADLDGDRAMDLVVANYSNGTWTSMDSFVYYGGLADPNARSTPGAWSCYPFKSRTSLPGMNAARASVGDLNKDGYQDIVFAFSGGYWEYRGNSKPSLIPSRVYWGGRDGYVRNRYSDLPCKFVFPAIFRFASTTAVVISKLVR